MMVSIDINGVNLHASLGRLCLVLRSEDEDPTLTRSSCIPPEKARALGERGSVAKFRVANPMSYLKLTASVTDSEGEVRKIEGKVGRVGDDWTGSEAGTIRPSTTLEQIS